MKMNDEASGAIPLILYVLTIIAAGMLYTMLFIVVYPSFHPLIPDSVFKSVIVWGICYFAPLIVIVVGILALIREAQKESPLWRDA